MSDSLISASLPEQDSRLRIMTMMFSAISSRSPPGTDGGHAGPVDAAVLDALGADGPGQRDAARLQVQHRLALRAGHQDLGARP